MKKTLLLVVVLLFGSLFVGRADLLVGFEFYDYAGDEARGTSTVENANIQVAYIERGSGINASANAHRFNANNWTETAHDDAITANDYFTWTVNAKAGATFSVTNIVFNLQHSATGGTNWFLRSSVDSFSSDLATWTGLANGTYVADLSSAGIDNKTTVEFRMYGWGGTGSSGTAGFEGSGDDLVVNGVSAIPEPGTLALFGSALAGLLILRRRWRI